MIILNLIHGKRVILKVVRVLRHMNVPIFDGDRVVIVVGVGNKEEEYGETEVEQLTLLMQGMWRLAERKRAEKMLREKEEQYRNYRKTYPLISARFYRTER